MSRSTPTISLFEASKHCQYSQEYLSLRARQGKLKAIKQGRNWVTTRAWLKEYVQSVSHAPSSLKLPARFFAMTTGAVVALLLAIGVASGAVQVQGKGIIKAMDAQFANNVRVLSEGGAYWAGSVIQNDPPPVILSDNEESLPSQEDSSGRILQNDTLRSLDVRLAESVRVFSARNAEWAENSSPLFLASSGSLMFDYFAWLKKSVVLLVERVSEEGERVTQQFVKITKKQNVILSDNEESPSTQEDSSGRTLQNDTPDTITNNQDTITKPADSSGEESVILSDNEESPSTQADSSGRTLQNDTPDTITNNQETITEQISITLPTGDLPKGDNNQTVREQESIAALAKRVEDPELTRGAAGPELMRRISILQSLSTATTSALSQVLAWKGEIDELKAITAKLQSAPSSFATQPQVVNTPVYIGTPGLQVGGSASFESLGVSGSAGVRDLGVGRSASIGKDQTDTFNVAAASTFTNPVVIRSSLTVGTGTLTIDATGALSTTTSVRITDSAGATKALLDNTGALTVSGALTSTSPSPSVFPSLTVTGNTSSNTFNSLTLTSNATGFTIAGGTTSKTLTLDTNITASSLVLNTRTLNTTLPLSGGGDLSADRTLAIGGLSTLGTANYLLGVNSAATSWEYKSIAGTTNQITLTHGASSITLSTPQDIATSSSPTFANLTLSTAGALRTSTTATNTLLLQAYDTDGVSYTTFATLTAGTTPTFDLSTTTTVGTNYIYRTGGTDIPLADGGTNASLTASNGGIFYSTATAGAILAGTATANQALLSGSTAAPAWSTATYPATTTVNQLLYSSSTNVIAGLSTANSGVLVTGATGIPAISTDIPTAVTIGTNYIYRAGGTDVPVTDGGTGVSSWTNGQLLIGNTTGNTAALATLTGTTNQITVTNGASSITLSTPQDIATASPPTFANLTLSTAGALRTSTTLGNTLLLQAYDTDTGPGYTTFATLTAGATPTFDLSTATTIGTNYIYRVGGTDISLADGGTNASLTASNGGIFYSTATAGAILAGTATANQALLSGASTTPSWSTATYPATTTVNQLLYSSSDNVIAGLATANSGVLVTSGAGVPSIATDIPTAVTIGTNYIYRAGGTDVSVADGGTGVGTFASNGMLYGNGTGALQATAQGGTNTILTASAGAPAWSATPIINTSLQIGVASTATGQLKLAHASSANLTTLQAGAAAADLTFTWPTADGTEDGQVLRTDGVGVLSWVTPAGGNVAWSAVTAPTANLSLAMVAYTTTLTYGNATSTNNLFNLADTASNTGTGYLLNVATASSSVLNPLRVSAAGTETLYANSSGNVGMGTLIPSFKLQVSGNIGPNSAPSQTSVSQTITTITSGTNLSETSIAIGVDGFPIVVHSNLNEGGTLVVVKCGNIACSSGNTSTTVNTGAVYSPSVVIGTDGFPVISHSGSGLWVTKCGNAACSSGNTTTSVDSNAGTPQSSIAIGTDGLSVIAYYDSVAQDLKVVKCGNATCSSGNTTTTLDSTGNVGAYPAMVVGTDGYPVIAYSDTTNSDIKVAKCSNASCSSSSTTAIDSNANTGSGVGIAIGADGFPVVSYYDLNASNWGSLGVVKCGNAACSSGNTSSQLDNANGSHKGRGSSVAIGLDGLPIIVYWNESSNSLYAAKCGNAACSSGNTLTSIQTNTWMGETTSVAIGTDGLPVMSFYQGSGTYIRVARCANTACSSTSGTALTGGSQLGGWMANPRSYSVPFQSVNTIQVSNPTTFQNLSFLTAGSEKLTITPTGNIGIGTTSPTSFKLQVAGDIGPNAAPTIGSASQTSTSVDTTNDVGYYASITIGADGLPVISYWDLTNSDLRVTKCGNAACSSGNTTTAVETTNSVGGYTSIAIGTDGLPVISHYYITGGDLYVTKCGNASCSSGNTTTAVDTTNNVGYYASIAIGTDGFPVIGYRDVTNTKLRVTKCGNAACSSGNTSTEVDTATDVGSYASIAVGTDGLPVISHHDAVALQLRVTKCGNAACSSGNTTTAVSTGNNIGQWASIAIGTDGLPIVSYQDTTNGDLIVTKCGNVFCSSGNTTTAVDTANSVGTHTSITIGADGLPIIGYRDVTNSDLRVTKCGNVSCSSGNTTTAVDTANNVGQYNSIAIAPDGLPVISHYDATSGDLRVTKCSDPACKNTTGSSLSSGSDLGSRQYYFKNVYAAQYWGRQFQIADFADVAEHYVSDTILPPGTIVRTKQGTSIEPTNTPYDPSMIGVVSTTPGISLATEQGNTPVALAGRVPIRVSTENGPINPGDYLTSSATPGVAMRATRKGPVIAKALESFPSFAEASEGKGQESTVLAFLNLSYLGNNLSVTKAKDGSIEDADTLELKGNLAKLGIEFDKEGAAHIATLATPTMRVRELVVRDQKTGDEYCTWVSDGRLVKVRGECPDTITNNQETITKQIPNFNEQTSQSAITDSVPATATVTEEEDGVQYVNAE